MKRVAMAPRSSPAPHLGCSHMHRARATHAPNAVSWLDTPLAHHGEVNDHRHSNPREKLKTRRDAQTQSRRCVKTNCVGATFDWLSRLKSMVSPHAAASG